MLASGCDGFVVTKEIAEEGQETDLELVVIGYGFATSFVVACGEAALSLVIGVSVLGAAEASELSFLPS